MRDVDAGLIDRIIVMRLDRWFRNVYDYHKMMNEHLIPHNVDWCAVKEDYDTTTTNGRLMINLRLAIAEQECDTDGDRIRDVQENMIQKGCCLLFTSQIVARSTVCVLSCFHLVSLH